MMKHELEVEAGLVATTTASNATTASATATGQQSQQIECGDQKPLLESCEDSDFEVKIKHTDLDLDLDLTECNAKEQLQKDLKPNPEQITTMLKDEPGIFLFASEVDLKPVSLTQKKTPDNNVVEMRPLSGECESFDDLCRLDKKLKIKMEKGPMMSLFASEVDLTPVGPQLTLHEHTANENYVGEMRLQSAESENVNATCRSTCSLDVKPNIMENVVKQEVLLDQAEVTEFGDTEGQVRDDKEMCPAAVMLGEHHVSQDQEMKIQISDVRSLSCEEFNPDAASVPSTSALKVSRDSTTLWQPQDVKSSLLTANQKSEDLKGCGSQNGFLKGFAVVLLDKSGPKCSTKRVKEHRVWSRSSEDDLSEAQRLAWRTEANKKYYENRSPEVIARRRDKCKANQQAYRDRKKLAKRTSQPAPPVPKTRAEQMAINEEKAKKAEYMRKYRASLPPEKKEALNSKRRKRYFNESSQTVQIPCPPQCSPCIDPASVISSPCSVVVQTPNFTSLPSSTTQLCSTTHPSSTAQPSSTTTTHPSSTA